MENWGMPSTNVESDCVRDLPEQRNYGRYAPEIIKELRSRNHKDNFSGVAIGRDFWRSHSDFCEAKISCLRQ